MNEVEVEDLHAEPDEVCVYTIDHEVNVVDLSQSGCEVNNIKEKKTAREWDPRTKNKQPGNGTPRTQEQTGKEWDPRTHESLVMVDSGASVNVCPKWFGNSNWNRLMMQLVSEEQTENRSKNTERDGSGRNLRSDETV